MSDIGQQLADAYQAAGQDGEPPLEQILDALQAGETEIERLYAINADLLAALEAVDGVDAHGYWAAPMSSTLREQVRAAIAKAKSSATLDIPDADCQNVGAHSDAHGERFRVR